MICSGCRASQLAEPADHDDRGLCRGLAAPTCWRANGPPGCTDPRRRAFNRMTARMSKRKSGLAAGFFYFTGANNTRASSSAARHIPHITIIGIQNRNGIFASLLIVSWLDNAASVRALRQKFVIGNGLQAGNLCGLPRK
jgi:hypothetical protein